MEHLLSHLPTLKTQLIAAIDPTFIDELKHDRLGFASTSCPARLNHLQSTYVRITPVHYARKQMKVLMNNNCVLVIRFNVK
jgi:hypothetical protein